MVHIHRTGMPAMCKTSAQRTIALRFALAGSGHAKRSLELARRAGSQCEADAAVPGPDTHAWYMYIGRIGPIWVYGYGRISC